MKYFFKLSHNLQLYWKRTPSQLLSDEIRKTFLNTVLYQKDGKSRKGFEETEAFPEDVQEKNWSKKFHKIHPKETVMKSSF